MAPEGARRIVLASGNAGKQREFGELLAAHHLELILQSSLGIASIEETGSTFEANALAKARHAARCAALPALADDSGLEVDALGGRPGVHSARYAGEGASDQDNNAKLLAELRGVPAPARTGRYQCVLALVRSADDPEPLLARGTWAGRIAAAPAGERGFGYDPLFSPQGLDCTAAQLSAQLKNSLSHRGRALAELLLQLQCLRW